MIDLESADAGSRVVHSVTRAHGTVTEVRKRVPAPLMFTVKWDDGREGLYHPEQLDLPSAAEPPPAIKLTPIGRTTPDYLWKLRRTLPRSSKPLTRQQLEKAADLICQLNPKKRKSKQKAQAIARKREVV